MNENEDGGFEVEASPTFFGSSGGGGLVEEDDDIEQLPQQDDESTMNDESESTIAASSYISEGYSYVASNTKWFVIAMASFVVFFSIGVGLGYGPIGNSIYGNNDDASSVSSAMAVDFTASDHGGKSGKSGGDGAKSGKSKSDKSSGVSCVECVIYFVHMI